ncbi:MAG: hypothetical protein F6K39_02295 [Okeania sp. SIO3B3]|nr:hypothetical protein [Okeania sp. SIO3B3]
MPKIVIGGANDSRKTTVAPRLGESIPIIKDDKMVKLTADQILPLESSR